MTAQAFPGGRREHRPAAEGEHAFGGVQRLGDDLALEGTERVFAVLR